MNKLIGISGKKRSGKDTFAKILQRSLYEKYETKSFANNLKRICGIITGLPEYYFFDDNYKPYYLEDWGMSVRQMLQILGTESLRDNFDNDIWIKSLMSTYNDHSNWIITDVRFKGELDAIKRLGGIVVRIDASYEGYSIPDDQHQSEVDLDRSYSEFDHIILNDSDYIGLETKAKQLVKEWIDE